MMNERGKSDPAVVAAKLANKAERSAAEPVEPRAGTKGNANQQHPGRTQRRETVSQVLARIRQTARPAICRHSPEVGAVCGKAARTDLCGGRGAISVPTATDLSSPQTRRLSRGIAVVLPTQTQRPSLARHCQLLRRHKSAAFWGTPVVVPA